MNLGPLGRGYSQHDGLGGVNGDDPSKPCRHDHHRVRCVILHERTANKNFGNSIKNAINKIKITS